MIATVTHARLRAAQGDIAGAMGILGRVLAATPGDSEAARLREELVSLRTTVPRHIVVARLRAWIGGLQARREERHDR